MGRSGACGWCGGGPWMVRGWCCGWCRVDGAVVGAVGAVDGAVGGVDDQLWTMRGSVRKNVGGLRIIQNHGVNTPWVIYPRRGHGVFTACCAMSLARRAGGFSRLPEPAVAWQLNQGPPKWRCAMLRLPKPRGRGKWALFFDFFPLWVDLRAVAFWFTSRVWHVNPGASPVTGYFASECRV